MISNHDSIAIAAYFLWEGEGRPHGRHADHWFAAEAALTHAALPEAVEAAPAPAAKAAPVRKPAAKKAAPARAAKPAAPKAPAEAVMAAAALAAPRTARTTSKGARNAH